MKRLRALLSALLISPSIFVQAAEPISIKKSVKPSPITKDIMVVAWVRPDTISLQTSGVNQDLIDQLDSFIQCGLQLLDWENGLRTSIEAEPDRIYANAFLLKNSPNAPPPNTIPNPAAYAAAGDFRLFNRAKAEFRVQNGQIVGSPRFIFTETPIVGLTPEPCSGVPLIRVAGQNHPNNGTQGRATNSSFAYQINEGRIGEKGQKVDRTLNDCNQLNCDGVPIGPTTPWIWSSIKFDATGELIRPVDRQIFPTYQVYSDRQLLDFHQQSDPELFISRDATSQRVSGDY